MIWYYLRTSALATKDRLIYRTDALIEFATSFVFDYVKVAIWAVVLASVSSATAKQEALSYMVFAAGISSMFVSSNVSFLSDAHLTGSLTALMTRPVAPVFDRVFQAVGGAIGVFVIRSVPTIALLWLIFPIQLELSVPRILAGLSLLAMGYIIHILVVQLVDGLTFWVLDTFSLHRLRDSLVRFLGGALVPLWFYPESILQVIEQLPFRSIVFAPAAVLSGVISVAAVREELIRAVAWIGGLGTLCLAEWRVGLRRISSFGG